MHIYYPHKHMRTDSHLYIMFVCREREELLIDVKNEFDHGNKKYTLGNILHWLLKAQCFLSQKNTKQDKRSL